MMTIVVPQNGRYKLVVVAPPGAMTSASVLVNIGTSLFNIGAKSTPSYDCKMVANEGSCWINFSTPVKTPRPGGTVTYTMLVQPSSVRGAVMSPPVYVAVVRYGD